MTIDHGQILEIINAGIQAPSADNSQPWKFKIGDDSIDVLIDSARVGMFFDSALSATYMSLGAVCENMVLCAGKLGLSANVEMQVGHALDSGHIFTLRLHKNGAVYDELSGHINERTTNRFLYRRQAVVPESILMTIAHSIHADQGCRVFWADEPATRKRIARAVFLSDLVRFTHPRIHHDFHEKLRFGKASQDSNDGLAADTLGIERPLLPILKLLRPWQRTHLLNAVGLHYVMAWRGSLLPMWASSAVGIIVAKAHVDYFDMGRAMERVWLASTRTGLSFQALGALPLLLIRLHEQDGEGFLEGHKKLLNRADAAWRIGADIAPEDRLAMVFRVGYTSKSVAKSKRRSIGSFFP